MVISRKCKLSKVHLFFGDCQPRINEKIDIVGVIKDKKLIWCAHIQSVTSKTGQRLGALQRVSNKLDPKGRATVYKAQVRSVMEYAPLCWVNASATTLDLLNNTQKALKIIGINEASAQYEVSISSLTHRHHIASLCILYKMQTKQYVKDLHDMLPPSVITRWVTRSRTSLPDHALTLHVPDAKTITLDRSFLQMAIQLWNSLPAHNVGYTELYRAI